MQTEIIIECKNCKAAINKDTIQELIYDIQDYLDEEIYGPMVEYLEDGSIGLAAFNHGYIAINYLSGFGLVRINIYYRMPFVIKELEERLNLYFIPDSIEHKSVV